MRWRHELILYVTVDTIQPQGVGTRKKCYRVHVSVRPKGGGHTNAVTFGPTTNSLWLNKNTN